MLGRTKYIGAGVVLLIVSCGPSKAKRAEEAQLRLQVAQQLMEKGDSNQGLSELVQAEQLDPESAEIQNMLGLAFLQNDRLELAEQHFLKAAKLDPKFSEAQNHVCALKVRNQQYDEAIHYCQKAVENVLYATPERAYQNMGVAYQKKGDTQKAIENFRKALVHNANFVLSRKSLGDMFMDQKKYSDAIEQYEAASSACRAARGAWGSDCVEIYYQKALAYMKIKDRNRAVGAFQSCVEADTNEGNYGKKCRENLKILQ